MLFVQCHIVTSLGVPPSTPIQTSGSAIGQVRPTVDDWPWAAAARNTAPITSILVVPNCHAATRMREGSCSTASLVSILRVAVGFADDRADKIGRAHV